MTVAQTSGRPRRAASGRPQRERFAGWALLAETMLVGVVTLPALVLVVPFPAAVAAGSAHLRRHVTGHPDAVGRLVRELLVAVRPLAPLGLALLGLLVLGTLNLLAAGSGQLAGGRLVTAATLLVLAAGAVVVLRAGAAWSDGEGRDLPRPSTRRLVGAAARRSVADPSGSVLLVAAVVAAAVFVWSLPALLVVVGGLLCLAAVGVEARRPAQPVA